MNLILENVWDYKLKIIEAFQLDDFLNYHMKILYQY